MTRVPLIRLGANTAILVGLVRTGYKMTFEVLCERSLFVRVSMMSQACDISRKRRSVGSTTRASQGVLISRCDAGRVGVAYTTDWRG